MPSITPFLWFNSQAGEAASFYASIFPSAKVLSVNPMMAEFELQGQRFMALNGGPVYTFNEAVSFFIGCENQQEIDDYWTKLTADGGEPGRCGWLKDKFGLSWQLVPNALSRLMGGGGDPARSKRVVDALMQMGKIDLARLEQAYEGL